MIRANYHTHTTLCDGKDTPAAMAEAARRLGIARRTLYRKLDEYKNKGVNVP